MSILNRPSDGLFNVLIVLVRCLLAQGAMNREKLLSICALRLRSNHRSVQRRLLTAGCSCLHHYLARSINCMNVAR